MSSRSPVEKPALASSPKISAAVATSSAPPGGATGPLARSKSDSKPCLGTSSEGGEWEGRGGGAERRLLEAALRSTEAGWRLGAGALGLIDAVARLGAAVGFDAVARLGAAVVGLFDAVARLGAAAGLTDAVARLGAAALDGAARLDLARTAPLFGLTVRAGLVLAAVAGVAGVLRRARAVARTGVAGVALLGELALAPDPPGFFARLLVASACRAATRRALDRCGRVRGKLERTPSRAARSLARPLLSPVALMRTSLLNAAPASRTPISRFLGGDALA